MSAAPRPRSPAAPLSRLSKIESRALARVAAAGEAGAPAAARADEAAVAGLVARGLVERRSGRLAVTPEGRARLARDTGGAHGFLAQHRALGRRSQEVAGAREDLLVDLDESPLAWLARRKSRDGRPLLAAEEVAAGERLRADFTFAQMTPRVTANWEASVASGRRGGGGARSSSATPSSPPRRA